ncbi:DMT family transporter [Luteimonas sp. XNQY3]|nr:DMT family transporter [Luteimonas sp. XNQY3]
MGGSLSVPTEPQVWVAVVWLTVFSTFIAYLVPWQLLKMMSATRMSALVYLEPPVTLLWAAWMFGDAIQWTTYAGVVVVTLGIVIARQRAKPVPCAQT